MKDLLAVKEEMFASDFDNEKHVVEPYDDEKDDGDDDGEDDSDSG